MTGVPQVWASTLYLCLGYVENIVKISMKKFGEILISRPAGKEAFLATSTYLLSPPPTGTIELDFAGVKVLAPS